MQLVSVNGCLTTPVILQLKSNPTRSQRITPLFIANMISEIDSTLSEHTLILCNQLINALSRHFIYSSVYGIRFDFEGFFKLDFKRIASNNSVNPTPIIKSSISISI